MNHPFQYLLAIVIVVLIALYAFGEIRTALTKQAETTAEQMKGRQ